MILSAGKWQGKPLPVSHFPFLVGRDPDCQLRPNSSKVSRHHCGLLARDGQFFLHDFGSTNGTLINGRRLEGGKLELREGDRVSVGPLEFAILIIPEAPPIEKMVPYEEPLPSALAARKPPPADDDTETLVEDAHSARGKTVGSYEEPLPAPLRPAPRTAVESEAAVVEFLLANPDDASSPAGEEDVNIPDDATDMDKPGLQGPPEEGADEHAKRRGPGGRPEAGTAGDVARQLLKKYRKSMHDREEE
jgi:predicted component of type VI protein secretion system